jgi:energy-coupling factor transporter ATP-binding protein EcfA2
MSNSVLILGESGSGKSTSIRNLNPDETVIINVIGKPLPFRGAKSKYTKISEDGMSGNYYSSDSTAMIIKLIRLINNKRPEIKNLIIDDFGYTYTNSFMRTINQKGYDKFNDLGKSTFDVLEEIVGVRDDLFCFVMMHTELDNQGKYKPKTIGNIIDKHIVIEGKFTYCLHAIVNDGKYRFLTNNDGQHMAKTPLGLYEDMLIDNDLAAVIERIKHYEDEG